MKAKWVDFKSPLAEGIKAFITYKRSIGRRFNTEEKALRLLDRYFVEQCVININDITPELLNCFLLSRPRKRARSYNGLAGILNRLFNWLVRQEIIESSPFHLQLKREAEKRIPFIFDIVQIRRLLEVTGRLSDHSSSPMRGITYQMIFILLYGLGLRAGEVARLYWKDIDFNRNLVIIRHTKFSKSRLVPFGPQLAVRISEYKKQREHRYGKLSPDAPVFFFFKNRAIHPATISQTFHCLLPLLDLDVPTGVRPPRLHDLRHSFAVGTLLRWYRSGINPATRLLHLSTFMGHVNPASTAVYLTITNELLEEANKRFERFAFPII